MAFRRKSVFAEAYDEDDEEEQVKVSYSTSHMLTSTSCVLLARWSIPSLMNKGSD